MSFSSAVSKAPKTFGHSWIGSSIGQKTIVAVTGIILILFVFGHLLGNLTIFLGPEWINSYAQHLRDWGPLLWMVRVVLILAVLLHIYFTMLLWNSAAKGTPEKTVFRTQIQTTIFSRTMRLSGLIIFAFVVFHLAHFTWGWIQPEYAHLNTDQNQHNVFAMMVYGFRNPYIVAFYILGLALLAFHLSHGIGSLFQTLGLSNQKLRPLFNTAGRWIAWALFLGYVSIPLSIFFFGLGNDLVK
ncbi:MAG: succinate:quinone oxidoreductase [Verrucomicrobia bacterium]|nr:MAG: succinate:quinone oxidoreductase [Verrucomicrobiota bacterium]